MVGWGNFVVLVRYMSDGVAVQLLSAPPLGAACCANSLQKTALDEHRLILHRLHHLQRQIHNGDGIVGLGVLDEKLKGFAV